MRANNTATTIALSLLLLLGVQAGDAYAENLKLLFGLRGEWKFEIGDNERRAEREFDDSKWGTVYAPASWEDEGYPGYDGYAWYRKHFRSNPTWQGKSLVLNLGNIDDVDEVFLNGYRIGATGLFPPYYQTAYNIGRRYFISPSYLNASGDNVIAIRVYDQELSGGITSGNLGVYEDADAIQADIQLAGEWKFQEGDDMNWRNPSFNDANWEKIPVPAFWEAVGYPGYDGFGWYRVRFRVPRNLMNEKLIVILGKIDDFDETFLNGERIGKTGIMANRNRDIPGSYAYQQVRAYVLPGELLKQNEDNVIAVRVYDGFQDGGIYSGPVGIVTREHFMRWDNKQKKQRADEYKGFFDWLFR